MAEVARRHDLGSQWLNDSAAGFLPQTLKEEECTVLVDHPRLRVLGAPLRQIFVMKLLASRALDVADLAAIWNECGFDSPEQAAALYQAAYPHLEPDQYLVDEIRIIAGRAPGSDRAGSEA